MKMSPGFATPSRVVVADGTDNGGVVRNPLTHAQRMHAAGAQVERLTNDVDALRAAMRAILNMEGADGMTDARFAGRALEIARRALEDTDGR